MSDMGLVMAARSLLRNRWRSGLTAAGVALATGLVVWFVHLSEAMNSAMEDSVTRVELGDLQIASDAWVEEPSLYEALPIEKARLDELRGLSGVAGASPRVQAFGLVGHEKRSAVARLVGVDATFEGTVSDLPTSVKKGVWLSPSPEPPPAAREVVLGLALANQLEVGPGAELVVFAQAADGSLGNDLLRVVGVASTQNAAVDRMAVWMHLKDAQWLTALEGAAHQVVVSTQRGTVLDAVRDDVAAAISDSTVKVRTWREVVPEMAQVIETSQGMMGVLYFIVYLLAGLGLLNTQRMTALERRREFGVLLAIGTTPVRLARQIVAESVLLVAFGAVLGTGLGLGLSWYHQEVGLAMGAASGEEGKPLTYMGVNFETFYFHVDPGLVVGPVGVLLVVGMVCALWPAIQSARLDMPAAISGRT